MAELLAELTTAIPQLSQLPQCILPAYGAIAGAGCGPDLACICGNDMFFYTLEGVLAKGACTPVEAQEAFMSTQSICAKAAPWLTHSRGPEVFAAIIILTVFSTIAFLLRVLARRFAKQTFGVDDWLIAVALLFAYGLTITECFGVHNGFGKHILMLTPDQITTFTKCYFAGTIIFVVSAAAAKLSILVFYQRIFLERKFRIISIAIGVITIAWLVSYLFIVFFTCVPLAYWWDKTIPGGHCINQSDTGYFGTIPPDVLTNIAILVLPIPYLWQLQMPQWKKLALTFIFLLGSFATVGSIVRIPLIHEINGYDLPYSITNSGIWLNVECNIGILSACLPMLRPVFSRLLPPSLRSRFTRSRKSYEVGSERLGDVEKSGNTHRSSTLVGSHNGGGSTTGGGEAGNIYRGEQAHKAWMNTNVSAMPSRHEDGGSEGSQEEMIPMGNIAVRRELDWETKDDA